MRKDIFEKNWFWIVVIAVLLLVLQLTHVFPVPQVNHIIYDTSISLLHKSSGSADKVAIISIDKEDLNTQEQKLSTKEALAKLIEKLRKARSKSVTVLIPLADKQHQPSLEYFAEISEFVKKAKVSKSVRYKLDKMIGKARVAVDVDGLLTQRVKRSHNVFFPFHITPDAEEPDFIHYYFLKAKKNEGTFSALLSTSKQERTVTYRDSWPFTSLTAAARGLGYFSVLEDTDGSTRTLELAHAYKENWIASLPLVLAAHALQTRIKDIVFEPGSYISIGNKKLSIDTDNRIYSSFYTARNDEESTFPHYSYTQVLSGSIPKRDLRGKIILVESSDIYSVGAVDTPVGELGVAELIAHGVTSILNQDIYTRPNSFLWLEAALFILVGAYLILLLPRFRLTTGSLISLFLLVALLALEEYLLLGKQAWLQGGASILFLVLGYMVFAAQRLFTAQHARHAEDANFTNRQLGLMLQEQGKLEQAFERLQKLTPNKENLDLIYNLALDFERKRKFNNAASAYAYIVKYKPRFRDVKSRMSKAEKTQHSMTMMGTGQFNMIGSLLVDGNEKPMLGRYVIEKELGKGAMGAVYLGKDPKIDRVVAIKTLALAQEFESTELKEVETRFFHEASAAGRLNHPNIVTIYDAAEDHDLAYIAMEYIEGKPLSDFVQKSKLLPIRTVLSIVEKTADALDYAGKQEIVHRDIKPANIMYNEATNVTKIMDFGIARIASTGRTRTGMILGTPSYMSPEQMNGERVDARSDIFSLGVTMFVLLTGQKPFQGDSLAAISYKIVNEKHPEILSIRKELPEAISKIINKALQKNPNKRYQTASVMRLAILRCLKSMIKD